MRVHLQYLKAHVWYEDAVKRPTPEYVDDVLARLGRALDRMWAGGTPEPADLSEYEQDMAEDEAPTDPPA